MKTTTPHWMAIILLSTVIVGIGIKFIVPGSTVDSDAKDSRIQVLLNAGERQKVLLEMRSLLEATQQIVEGLASNNMKQVADASSSVGMQATSTMDVTLKTKLPMEFKKLGFATHAAFDEITAMAEKGAGTTAIQKKLATTMSNCVACHASFQLPTSSAKGEQ